MAIGANSYGSAAGVGVYVTLYTNNGVFDTTTNPTIATVESWLDEVSAIANTALASNGFSVPLTQADAVLSLQGIINQHVADLCHAMHSTGRFFTDRALSFGMSPMNVIRKELLDWVISNAAGLEALGATRGDSAQYAIGYLEQDQSGDEIFPIFQREAFGNKFENWDND